MKSILRSLGVQSSRTLQKLARRARLTSRRRPSVRELSEENPNLVLDWEAVKFCEKLRF